MTIEPNSLVLSSGETMYCVINDYVTEHEEAYSIVVTDPTKCTVTRNQNLLTVTGLLQGNTSFTVSDSEAGTSATVTVLVEQSATWGTLTADGSGTGNDTSVFGRQFIMNNNNALIKKVADKIHNLSKVTTALVTANLAGMAVNIGALLIGLNEIEDTLDEMQLTYYAKNSSKFGPPNR